jgi:hypothetical protein
MSFLEGEIAILNDRAKKGMPQRIGERGVIIITDEFNSPNYDYVLEFDDGTTSPVREEELYKLSEEDKKTMEYIFTGNKAIFKPANEKVIIKKVDYIHEKAEVEFLGGGTSVIDFEKLSPEFLIEEIKEPQIEKLGKFTELAYGIGEFTDMKNQQYGSSVDATYGMITVLMERYKNDDNTYTIPQSLLQHILLQVRMMDKINRIFNNPSGEGDSESPYQ